MEDEIPSDETATNAEPTQRRMTTDPERIREWADARDAVPVSIRGGDSHGHSFAHRDELGTDHEEYTWEEFAAALEDEDLVFVYHEDAPSGEGLGHFELVERETAFDRADLGRDELEDQLRQGETVTTEIVETQVVETEVVERDTIESEVVDTELADRQVVDSELLTREIVDTEFVTADVIEVTTDETRLETVEEIERYTVESRVVDVDLEHDEQVERDEIETDVELESVQRSIVESDVVRADVSADDVLDQEVIRSKRGEGDTVRSELVERRTLEEEIDERTRMRFTLEETDLLKSETAGSEVLEGEIIGVEEYGAIEPTGEPASATGDVEAQPGTEASAATGTGSSNVDASAVELSDDDQGKAIVDETGQEIGIVADVEGGTAYVDPEPGLTDRIKARLNWGGQDGEEYPVHASEIDDITDDEVIIRHSGDER